MKALRVLVLFWICLAYLFWGPSQPVFAQEPEKRREFAWGIIAFTGREYTGVFSPSEVPTIYVLAGRVQLLRARYTMVYYWPIDRQYKPDWTALNQEVPGTLVIQSPGNQVTRVESQSYLILPLESSPNILGRVLLGADATAAYRKYEQERDAYLKSVADYDALFEAYLKARALDPKTTLAAPKPPLTFNQAMSPPDYGFPVSLPPGVYQLYLANASGQVVPGSQRTLISVEPRRESVGYTVIPESKWTIQEESDTQSQIIYYALGNPAVYLQPFRTLEYNEQANVRLENPQDTASSANRWTWMHDTPLDQVQLQVWTGGRLVSQVEMKPYSVQQVSGSALGYQVVPFDPAVFTAADFEAFRVALLPGVADYSVRLVRADGTVIAGSERTLVNASDDLPFSAYTLVFLPLLVSWGVGQWRKRGRTPQSPAADNQIQPEK